MTGRCDEEIRAAAAAVRGAAPARIMVCVQHEWDHRLNAAPPDAQGRCPSPGKDECTSGANLRRLFGHIQKSFDQAGASNAVSRPEACAPSPNPLLFASCPHRAVAVAQVWVVDYSTHSADDPEAVMETWPVHRHGFENDAYRQARVDFVFFNAYAGPSQNAEPRTP